MAKQSNAVLRLFVSMEQVFVRPTDSCFGSVHGDCMFGTRRSKFFFSKCTTLYMFNVISIQPESYDKHSIKFSCQYQSNRCYKILPFSGISYDYCLLSGFPDFYLDFMATAMKINYCSSWPKRYGTIELDIERQNMLSGCHAPSATTAWY